MQLARVAHVDGVSFVQLDSDDSVPGASGELGVWAREIAEHPFGNPTFTGRQWPLADVRLLAPILSTKIISLTRVRDDSFQFIIKPNTTIASMNATVVRPDEAKELYAGSTLAAVIGQPLRRASPKLSEKAILGYTLAMDFTALDIASVDGNFVRAKAYDGFCPLGPWIDTSFIPEGATVVEQINGQPGGSHKPLSSGLAVGEIISELSHIMTLLPGDALLLGAHIGEVPLENGATVTSSCGELGSLSVKLA